MTVRIDVLQEDRRPIDGADDDIDFSVVEQIAEGCPATRCRRCKPRSLDRRYVLEFPIMRVSIKQGPLSKGGAPVVLVHLGIDVAVDHHQVFPAVVVEVKKTNTPSDKRNSHLRNARLVADFSKAGVPVIPIQSLVVVGEIGHRQIHEAVVQVVANRQTHGGYLPALAIERETGDITLIIECAVALVDVKIVGLRVIGDKQVHLAVVVCIDKNGSESVVCAGVRYTRLDAHIRERAISIVLE